VRRQPSRLGAAARGDLLARGHGGSAKVERRAFSAGPAAADNGDVFHQKKKDGQQSHAELLIKLGDVAALATILVDPQTKGATARIALDALVGTDSAESWDAIAAVLQASQSAVIELVIQRLEEIDGPGALRCLGDALSNPSVFIRGAAVRALGKRDAGQTMAHLLRAARDPEKSLARIAARTILRRVESRPAILGEIRPQTAEGILDLIDDRWAMELLSPSFPKSIRLMAVRRLGTIGGEESTQTLASLVTASEPEIAEACWKALESCQHVSSFILLPLLVNPQPEVKARALRVYAKFADDLAQDLFAGLARDASPIVRTAALSALTRVAQVGAIPTLEAAIEDKDEGVALHAMELLTQVPDSANELLGAVFKHTGELRRRALVCLANRGVITSDLVMPYIEFLYKGSSCTDLSQREYLDSLAAVAKTLGASQNFEAMLALTALARSVIRRLRRSAIEGLMMFPPEDRVDALFSLLDARDSDIVKNVAFGLHEAKDQRAVLPLIRTALECRGRPMVRAKDALREYPQINQLDFLVKCLKEKWPSVRRYAAERLKIVKDPGAIPTLLEVSQDEDVEVQLAVFEAMGPFAGTNPEVTSRMLDCLSFGDISVRQAVCEALGEARCKEAVPALVKALYNVFLRPRARDAIKLIGDRKGVLALRRLERRAKLFPKKPKDVMTDKKHRKAS
jgi:HEAT repeat protein